MGLLRIILALSVASGHWRLPVPILGQMPFRGHGAFSVSAFFIVSGFYMSLVLTERYLKTGGGLRLFYGARFFRLMPALAVALILSAALALWSGGTSISIWSVPLSDAAAQLSKMNIGWKLVVLVANTTSLFTDLLGLSAFTPDGTWIANKGVPGNFMLGASFALFPPGWSLSIELVFYAFAPFLVRRHWLLLAALALMSLWVRVYYIPGLGLSAYVWRYTFLPSEFVFFLLGIFAHRLYQVVRSWPPSVWIGRLALVAFVMFWISFGPMYDKMGADRLLALYTSVLAVSIPFLFVAFKNSRIDRAIGEMSYVIYLNHFLTYKFLSSVHLPLNPVVYFGVLIGFSLIVYLAVERPIEKWRRTFAARAAEPAVAVLVT